MERIFEEDLGRGGGRRGEERRGDGLKGLLDRCYVVHNLGGRVGFGWGYEFATEAVDVFA